MTNLRNTIYVPASEHSVSPEELQKIGETVIASLNAASTKNFFMNNLTTAFGLTDNSETIRLLSRLISQLR